MNADPAGIASPDDAAKIRAQIEAYFKEHEQWYSMLLRRGAETVDSLSNHAGKNGAFLDVQEVDRGEITTTVDVLNSDSEPHTVYHFGPPLDRTVQVKMSTSEDVNSNSTREVVMVKFVESDPRDDITNTSTSEQNNWMSLNSFLDQISNFPQKIEAAAATMSLVQKQDLSSPRDDIVAEKTTGAADPVVENPENPERVQLEEVQLEEVIVPKVDPVNGDEVAVDVAIEKDLRAESVDAVPSVVGPSGTSKISSVIPNYTDINMDQCEVVPTLDTRTTSTERVPVVRKSLRKSSSCSVSPQRRSSQQQKNAFAAQKATEKFGEIRKSFKPLEAQPIEHPFEQAAARRSLSESRSTRPPPGLKLPAPVINNNNIPTKFPIVQNRTFSVPDDSTKTEIDGGLQNITYPRNLRRSASVGLTKPHLDVAAPVRRGSFREKSKQFAHEVEAAHPLKDIHINGVKLEDLSSAPPKLEARKIDNINARVGTNASTIKSAVPLSIDAKNIVQNARPSRLSARTQSLSAPSIKLPDNYSGKNVCPQPVGLPPRIVPSSVDTSVNTGAALKNPTSNSSSSIQRLSSSPPSVVVPPAPAAPPASLSLDSGASLSQMVQSRAISQPRASTGTSTRGTRPSVALTTQASRRSRSMSPPKSSAKLRISGAKKVDSKAVNVIEQEQEQGSNATKKTLPTKPISVAKRPKALPKKPLKVNNTVADMSKSAKKENREEFKVVPEVANEQEEPRQRSKSVVMSAAKRNKLAAKLSSADGPSDGDILTANDITLDECQNAESTAETVETVEMEKVAGDDTLTTIREATEVEKEVANDTRETDQEEAKWSTPDVPMLAPPPAAESTETIVGSLVPENPSPTSSSPTPKRRTSVMSAAKRKKLGLTDEGDAGKLENTQPQQQQEVQPKKYLLEKPKDFSSNQKAESTMFAARPGETEQQRRSRRTFSRSPPPCSSSENDIAKSQQCVEDTGASPETAATASDNNSGNSDSNENSTISSGSRGSPKGSASIGSLDKKVQDAKKPSESEEETPSQKSSLPTFHSSVSLKHHEPGTAEAVAHHEREDERKDSKRKNSEGNYTNSIEPVIADHDVPPPNQAKGAPIHDFLHAPIEERSAIAFESSPKSRAGGVISFTDIGKSLGNASFSHNANGCDSKKHHDIQQSVPNSGVVPPPTSIAEDIILSESGGQSYTNDYSHVAASPGNSSPVLLHIEDIKAKTRAPAGSRPEDIPFLVQKGAGGHVAPPSSLLEPEFSEVQAGSHPDDIPFLLKQGAIAPPPSAVSDPSVTINPVTAGMMLDDSTPVSREAAQDMALKTAQDAAAVMQLSLQHAASVMGVSVPTELPRKSLEKLTAIGGKAFSVSGSEKSSKNTTNSILTETPVAQSSPVVNSSILKTAQIAKEPSQSVNQTVTMAQEQSSSPDGSASLYYRKKSPAGMVNVKAKAKAKSSLRAGSSSSSRGDRRKPPIPKVDEDLNLKKKEEEGWHPGRERKPALPSVFRHPKRKHSAEVSSGSTMGTVNRQLAAVVEGSNEEDGTNDVSPGTDVHSTSVTPLHHKKQPGLYENPHPYHFSDSLRSSGGSSGSRKSGDQI